MRMSEFIPQPQCIEHPKCERCGAGMWLAHIEPDDKPDHDRRTFECPRCQNEQIQVVKYL
jgi:ribosomal protein S27AE